MLIQQTAFSFFQFAHDSRFKIVTQPDELNEMVNFLRDKPRFAFDFETSGVAWWKHAEACGIAFTSHDPDEPRPRNYYVPYRHLTGQPQLAPELVLGAIAPLFENPNAEVIAHNIKFDEHILHKDGLRIVGPRHDTMIAAHLYDENTPKALKYRGVVDLGDPDAQLHDDLVSTEITRLAKLSGLNKTEYKDRFGYAGIDLWMLGRYAAHDTELTWRLFHKYQGLGILDFYKRVYATEMALTEALCDMEEIGVQIDVEYLQQLHVHLTKAKEQAEAAFFQAAGVQYFNLGSDDEIRHYLQKGLKLPLSKTTKKGALSVDEEVIHAFIPAYPHLQHLDRWRDCDKKTSTYTVALIERCDTNGVLHCDLQQVGTNTGRLACQKPNLQNQPSDDSGRAEAAPDKIDPESIKRAFIVPRKAPPPEWVGRKLYRLLSDYSQVELRVLARYSGDPRLVQTYINDGDIHDEVENAVFGTGKQTEKGPVNRRKAKVINFGLSYCMTAKGFAHQIEGVSEAEAQGYFDEYGRKFPGVISFRKGFWNQVKANYGRFENLFGRSRRLPMILSKSKWEQGRAERQAIATLIQGTAAEIMKESIVRVFRAMREEGLTSRCVLTVHDEVQVDGPVDEFAQVARLVKRVSEDYGDIFDPIPIVMDQEVTTKSWAHKVAVPK